MSYSHRTAVLQPSYSIVMIICPAHRQSAFRAQGNYRNGGIFWIVYSISFWLLFSYMIPISLFVTMEIVKAFQVRPHKAAAAGSVLNQTN